MDNKRIIFIVVIITVFIVALLLGVRYYFGPTGKTERAAGEVESVAPFRFSGERYAYSGIIQKIDFKNKFFEIKTAPNYPVSLKSFDFDDTFRFHYDDNLIFVTTIVETENGAIVKLVNPGTIAFNQLGPGFPVRAFGALSQDGTYLADILYLYEYKPK